MSVRLARWGPLAIATIVLATACGRTGRCGTCGMKVDPASAWVSYVTVNGREAPFDTPRCALAAWRGSGTVSGARFREYYSQELISADRIRFVAGSDVIGPMGPELVPVGLDNAVRFARDHNGAPPKTAEEALQEAAP
jgi:copper chaperone NosL